MRMVTATSHLSILYLSFPYILWQCELHEQTCLLSASLVILCLAGNNHSLCQWTSSMAHHLAVKILVISVRLTLVFRLPWKEDEPEPQFSRTSPFWLPCLCSIITERISIRKQLSGAACSNIIPVQWRQALLLLTMSNWFSFPRPKQLQGK